jgi:hypothetical protein
MENILKKKQMMNQMTKKGRIIGNGYTLFLLPIREEVNQDECR